MLPTELKESFQRDEAVLFLGAGLSIGAGLPGWPDLIRPLARSVGSHWPTNEADLTTNHLLAASQHYENQRGRNALLRHLRDVLDTTDVEPTTAHRLISFLPVRLIFTTNYDDLIERALREAARRPNTIVSETELTFWSEERIQVVKLCGDRHRPESIVITQRDFSTYFATHPRLTERLRTVLESRTALFVGYSLQDPFFNQIWDHIGLDFGRLRRRGYAVLFDVDPLRVDDLRQRGIYVINLEGLGIDKTSLLTEWLQTLLTESGLSSASNAQPTVEGGAEPTPPRRRMKQEPSLSPPTRERGRVYFKLQITQLTDQELEVRAFETPSGEYRSIAHLPYKLDELIAILKALPASSLDSAKLKPSQTDALRRLGLLTRDDLVPDLHMRVGKTLYQTLLPNDVGEAFRAALNQVRTQAGIVALQLRFDEDAALLARYPWELLYQRRHLLPSGAVELTRYISYPEATTTLSVEPPLRVLYVESRPADLPPLPRDDEQMIIRAALESLARDDLLVLEELTPPTYVALIDRIDSAQDHVLHFDGHGTVVRRCPACGTRNYPHYAACQKSGCGRSLEGVLPLGHLAFERDDDNRRVDWVDSKTLEHLLYGSTVRVAVLSACRSSEVGDETVFGGVGPALIQSGMPAVISMQLPVTVSATADFMEGFYGALARFESLPAAMTSGRRYLFRGQEWFIPTLYLRSQDDEGHLFTKS